MPEGTTGSVRCLLCRVMVGKTTLEVDNVPIQPNNSSMLVSNLFMQGPNVATGFTYNVITTFAFLNYQAHPNWQSTCRQHE